MNGKYTKEHLRKMMLDLARDPYQTSHGVARKYGVSRSLTFLILNRRIHRDIMDEVEAILDAEEAEDTDESLDALVRSRYDTMPKDCSRVRHPRGRKHATADEDDR